MMAPDGVFETVAVLGFRCALSHAERQRASHGDAHSVLSRPPLSPPRPSPFWESVFSSFFGEGMMSHATALLGGIPFSLGRPSPPLRPPFDRKQAVCSAFFSRCSLSLLDLECSASLWQRWVGAGTAIGQIAVAVALAVAQSCCSTALWLSAVAQQCCGTALWCSGAVVQCFVKCCSAAL